MPMAWCRLLAQADRRVLLLPQAARELTAVPRASAAPSAPQDPEVVRTKLLEVVTQWWDDEPEDLREDLRDELRGSHGIPQEVDRHMLLRVRRALMPSRIHASSCASTLSNLRLCTASVSSAAAFCVW